MFAIIGSHLALAQEPTTVARLWVAGEGEGRPRLVQVLGGLTSASADGVSYWYDPGREAYGLSDGEGAADPDTWAGARLDLNAWRRADPGAFVPGAMNGLLGVFGLSDARVVSLRLVREGSLVVGWDRRSEDPRTDPSHDVVVARRAADDSGCEVWEFGPIGIGAFVAGAVGAGLAIEEGERAPSDWAFADAWVRGRSELLRSLSRSTTRSALVITPTLETALVFWFDPAVKAASLERAAARIVPAGIPEVMVRGRSFHPAHAAAEGEDGAVVVLAPTQRDLDGVIGALGLRRYSGGDRP